jgi:hypothetical protein
LSYVGAAGVYDNTRAALTQDSKHWRGSILRKGL